ncbi:MAG: zinc-binding dehydrogenase, partial [Cyanobacteria bacterium P01_D01_bin.73]
FNLSVDFTQGCRIDFACDFGDGGFDFARIHQGRLGLIDDPQDLPIKPLKPKAISLHWEFMFTRSLFNTPDIESQSKLLNEISALVDAGKIKSTVTEVAGKIDAATLRKVHAQIESGKAKGKVVLEGF